MARPTLLLCLGCLLLAAAAVPAFAEIGELVTRELTAQTASRRRLLATCSSKKTPDYKGKCVCKPGYEGTPGGSCKLCKTGFYKDKRGNAACKQCPSGKYSSTEGATACKTCSSSTGLVNPRRTKCQGHCKTPNDHSVIHFGPFWSVNWFSYYYGYQAELTTAEICDRTHTDGAQNLIPAIIKSEDQRKVAAKLAEYHFKCNRKPAGQPNFDYGYFAWVLKAPGGAYPSYNETQCNYMFHTAGAGGDGVVSTLMGSQCVGPTPSGEWLPVLCSQGCARYCRFCASSGKCSTCLPGYALRDGKCLKLVSKVIS